MTISNTTPAPRPSCEMICSTCRFWDDSDGTEIEGDYRRHAPRLSGQAVPSGNATHQEPMFRAWPLTRIYDWCGEHQPQEAQSDADPS